MKTVSKGIVIKRKIVKLYAFFYLSVICIIVIIYKLYEGCYGYSNNSYSSSYKYIYDVLQYEEKEVVKIIKSENIQRLEHLQSINSEIVALLEINGTNINYPVLQTSDNTYYLTHNYKKEKSKDGALMLDKDCSLIKPTTNTLIYGHNNIGSKEMFADLTKYKNKDFYENHKIIKFTNMEEQLYEIICVFLSEVYYKAQTDVFKYYFFIDAKNKQEFNDFITNCKSLSLYDIGVTAEYGDVLMTLSTCEYSRPNGRLAVIAKKIK